MRGCYVVFHKQLGDLLLLEPALSRLAAHHGRPVRLLTRGGHDALVSLMADVEIHTGPTFKPARHLYCFDPVNKSATRALFTPAWHKTCILPCPNEASWFHKLIFHPIIVPGLGDEYIAEYFWNNTPVPAAGAFRMPRLNRPPNDWAVPGLETGGFVLINPTAGWKRKSWLGDRWAAVVRRIRERVNLPILMTSASTDWQISQCAEIERLAEGSIRSLSNGTTLQNFLWLCANAALVVTVDGAAAHIATASGTPSLALFGPTNIGNWHRGTNRNLAVQAPIGKDGTRRMRDLALAPVLETLDQLIA
ncbi:MAG: hypothetical protein BGO12_23525 [Verrucomicrobia bacterium 61-8]|nr:hypothetical protein [Verrucomicrobiota bacterium]OJV13814.1 MAG: hypothetical protein BGO12_23525 [Verrucomicrobia bacterium 61-8]